MLIWESPATAKKIEAEMGLISSIHKNNIKRKKDQHTSTKAYIVYFSNQD
jgi:hypothetical protein